ncbi:MAG: ABC transporter permease [Pseudomonadota bacterium]
MRSGPAVLDGVTTTFRQWPGNLKVGSAILAIITCAALLAPWLTPYDPYLQDYGRILQAPSLAHPFGTDQLGRDVFARVLFGARIDLEVGVITTYVPMVYGVALGALAGYRGGWLDVVTMRVIDLAIAFPFLVLIILILSVLGPGLQNVYIAVLLVGWTMYARLARAEMLVERNKPYILAAKVLGYSEARIVFRHALPNILPSSLVFSMVDFVLNILLVSGLSFLGLGAQPPSPEWGAIIAEGRDYILQAWWISTLPGLVIVLTGVGLALTGDGLATLFGSRQRAML